VVFLATFIFFLIKDSIKNESALLINNIVATLSNEQTNPALPSRLIIPNINVDATILPIGLTSQGAVGVPESPYDVAWFNLGPIPGAPGSAVISGHYGWKDNIPAAFDNLHKLQAGDRVYVKDEQKDVNVFVVRELKTYDLDEDVSLVFNSDDGKAHLNLITCKGAWDSIQKSYSQRLVVFTDEE
jgi:LPXTG-site transpeptidase (sortase) family protein